MSELFDLAREGDAMAIVLWEWLHFYPHVPAEEVAAILAMLEGESF